MPLYGISRARIQYLGQNVPFFRFQHSLFEALISALHPEEVSPTDTDNVTDLTSRDLVRQEKSLYKRYIQFKQSRVLNLLLELS